MTLTSEFEEYNAHWPAQFQTEASAIRSAIEPIWLVNIWHVGSTSIPGMLAKPEIDILVILKPEARFSDHFQRIESLGYRFRGEEPGEPSHWYFSKDVEGKRTHKLHLCGPAHVCVENQLLFRDYLIAAPDQALAYRTLKQDLAASNKHGMTEYLAKKAPFIRGILDLARAKAAVK